MTILLSGHLRLQPATRLSLAPKSCLITYSITYKIINCCTRLKASAPRTNREDKKTLLWIFSLGNLRCSSAWWTLTRAHSSWTHLANWSSKLAAQAARWPRQWPSPTNKPTSWVRSSWWHSLRDLSVSRRPRRNRTPTATSSSSSSRQPRSSVPQWAKKAGRNRTISPLSVRQWEWSATWLWPTWTKTSKTSRSQLKIKEMVTRCNKCRNSSRTRTLLGHWLINSETSHLKCNNYYQIAIKSD